MKHHIRLLALVIVLALTVSLVSGCGRRGPSESETLMAEQWHAFLAVNEQIFSHMHWACSYAETFCQDNQWESLLKARAAAGTAMLAIQNLALPTCTLTEEQCAELLRDGIEADAVLAEYESLEANRGFRLDTMNLLVNHLANDVYLKPDMEMIPLWLESSRSFTGMEMEYIWYATNYLLLQLERGELWEQWKAEFPVMAAHMPEWETDPDTVMDNTSRVLDAMAEELTSYSGYAGTSQFALELVQQATATGDLTALAAEINRIDGIPAYFPDTGFLPDVLPIYLYRDEETADNQLITAGEELTRVPNACYLSCIGVPLEDVTHYADTLTLWGLEPWLDLDQAAGTCQLLVSSGECTMMILWTEEKTELYLLNTVACLMPQLYLAAMSQ